MLLTSLQNAWKETISFIEKKSSRAEYQNWIAPIEILKEENGTLFLAVPNIFMREYLLSNYKEILLSFFPIDSKKKLPIEFVVTLPKRKPDEKKPQEKKPPDTSKFHKGYTFNTFIEGSANQFVKSAAMGVAKYPSRSYNPLFIHGGVGLGKTHLLHAIGHAIAKDHSHLKLEYITTEEFINAIVDNLRKRSVDKLKKFYRSLDVLLIDDIQFLQNRLNFEDEVCNTFESLIQQNKQIVITSDKPPTALKLSERLIARMEWGLVAEVTTPDLETRVAILEHKAEQKGISIPHQVSFFIAERVFNNVRQIEGAINRLSAHCKLLHLNVTQEVAEAALGEMLAHIPHKKISVDSILKSVSSTFDVKVSDLKGTSRLKKIAFPRQVAMYLAKELINDSLMKLASSFGGKTHSTLLHSWNKIKDKLKSDPSLKKQIDKTRHNLEA